MSKKLVKPVLIVAGIAATIASGGALAPLLYSVGIAAGAAVSISSAIIGAVSMIGISTAIGVAGSALGLGPKAPKVSAASQDRLTASLNPSAPRTMVFGRTAMATDVRYSAFTGTGQEFYHLIMAVAAHKVGAIEEIWFDNKLAWSVGAGVSGSFSGYLTVAAKLEGTSGNTVSIDANWGAAQRLTGCAYLHLRFKLTGNSKKAESPFAQGVPTRMTVRGKGMFLPDVREAGCDAADQTTWDWFDDDSGRNPAWHLLAYLIGWRINGKLSIGRGFPASRFDLDSFITAANMCDEAVTKAVGGTEPRYRTDGVFSENDPPDTVIANLLAAMNGVLRDSSGRLSLTVLHDDLATPVWELTQDNVIGNELWQQTPPIDEIYNAVRGRYTDPSDAGLYQLVDAPEVSIASVDNIERIETFDSALVQSGSQWQRLAKQRLQRAQYPGTYSADMNAAAWPASLGTAGRFSHSGLGWSQKLFRVIGQTISMTGVCRLVLREEHEDIYAWDAEESPSVEPAAPTDYDPLNSPVLQHLNTVEEFADVTAEHQVVVIRPVDQFVEADYLGAPITGQLARTLTPKVTKGGVDIRTAAGTTYAITVGPGLTGTTINNTGGSADKGKITTGPVMTALASYVDLTVTVDGIAQPTERILFERRDAAAPTSGGGGSAPVMDNIEGSLSSGTFATAAGPMTQVMGASGNASLSASAGYTASGAGTGTLELKWQQRTTSGPGAWTDVGAADAGLPATVGDDPGSCDSTETFVGTAAVSYDYQVLGRRSAGAATIHLYGTAEASTS